MTKSETPSNKGLGAIKVQFLSDEDLDARRPNETQAEASGISSGRIGELELLLFGSPAEMDLDSPPVKRIKQALQRGEHPVELDGLAEPYAGFKALAAEYLQLRSTKV